MAHAGAKAVRPHVVFLFLLRVGGRIIRRRHGPRANLDVRGEWEAFDALEFDAVLARRAVRRNDVERQEEVEDGRVVVVVLDMAFAGDDVEGSGRGLDGDGEGGVLWVCVCAAGFIGA